MMLFSRAGEEASFLGTAFLVHEKALPVQAYMVLKNGNRQGEKDAKKSPAPIFKDVSIKRGSQEFDELSGCKSCESPDTLKNGCRVPCWVQQQGKRLRHPALE